MKKISGAVLVLVLSSRAFAQESDQPLLYKVVEGRALTTEGPIDLPPGTFINEPGMDKLNRLFKEVQVRAIQKNAENEVLRAKVDELAARPAIDVPLVLGLVGGALLVGAAGGFALSLAVRK